MLIFYGLMGLALGSFNNVLIERLPKNESITGRSKCLECNTPLKWSENIPLLSFLVLKGKCKTCRGAISLRYPLVEVLTALMSILLVVNFDGDSLRILGLLYTSLGISASIIDWRWMRIPNAITSWLFALSFVLLLIDSANGSDWSPMIRALISAVVMSAIYFAIHLISGGGMGLGDVKYSASIGLTLGYIGYLPAYVAFLLSFAIGSAYGLLLMIVKGKGRKTKVPFAPFLFLGGYLALLIFA